MLEAVKMVPVKHVSDLEIITDLFCPLPQYLVLGSLPISLPTACQWFRVIFLFLPQVTEMSVWLYGIKVLEVEGFHGSLPQMIFPLKRNIINLCSTWMSSQIWEKQVDSLSKINFFMEEESSNQSWAFLSYCQQCVTVSTILRCFIATQVATVG